MANRFWPNVLVALARSDTLNKTSPKVVGDGFGRLLRNIAGVDERIIQWVPEERLKFTHLGAMILNSAILSGVSFMFAATYIGVNAWIAFLLCLFWAYLNLSLDRWLAASARGDSGPRHTRWLFHGIPRLLLASLTSMVVAGPIVLAIFKTEVEKRAAELGMSTHPLSLINSLQALQDLTQDGAVARAVYTIYTLFIAIGALPIIASEMMSSGSMYDQLVRRELKISRRKFDSQMQLSDSSIDVDEREVEYSPTHEEGRSCPNQPSMPDLPRQESSTE
ncbi:DUF4407 domain-containing protein [Nocardia salmonicida]|uniref:DUF4407 domain-containing protein n=1 Tax=Nocardia salmonicida TaxID=53431 RepID=UPI0033DBDD5D